MARVQRTAQARDDLENIGRHIARESGDRSIAVRFLQRIRDKCELYARQPLMGDTRNELAENVRCFSVGTYVVFYQPFRDGILILTVIHGARDIPSVFRQLFE